MEGVHNRRVILKDSFRLLIGYCKTARGDDRAYWKQVVRVEEKPNLVVGVGDISFGQSVISSILFEPMG